MHQRAGVARFEEADGLSGICYALHARESAGRTDGFVRGRVRCILPLPQTPEDESGDKDCSVDDLVGTGASPVLSAMLDNAVWSDGRLTVRIKQWRMQQNSQSLAAQLPSPRGTACSWATAAEASSAPNWFTTFFCLRSVTLHWRS